MSTAFLEFSPVLFSFGCVSRLCLSAALFSVAVSLGCAVSFGCVPLLRCSQWLFEQSKVKSRRSLNHIAVLFLLSVLDCMLSVYLVSL